jgi:exodeoxyribonuclease-5
MQLTIRQEQGLKVAIARYMNREKYTCISGYAGSGKSTLVKFIVNSIPGIDPEKDVCYACYTGKAAQVLLKKGNKNVSTLHKLMYESIPRADGTFFHKPVSEIPYKVVVVDEVSMVPGSMWKQLLRYRPYILALGDPFQLPPVNKDDDNGVLQKPHVFLDEIMRQAQESEIIRISMDIREGKNISLFDGNEVKIFSPKDFTEPMLTWADQILVGTNATRINLNNTMRRLLGREGGPQNGDKVICLRNDWETFADNGDPLVNGTIGFLQNPYTTYANFPRFLGGHRFEVLNSNFISDSGANFSSINMDKKMIMTGEKCCDLKTAWKLGQSKFGYLMPKEFTYGYAITCHKSQGSQWDKILIVEEGFPFDKTEHARWLYTAVTRAVEKAVIIRKN